MLFLQGAPESILFSGDYIILWRTYNSPEIILFSGEHLSLQRLYQVPQGRHPAAEFWKVGTTSMANIIVETHSM